MSTYLIQDNVVFVHKRKKLFFFDSSPLSLSGIKIIFPLIFKPINHKNIQFDQAVTKDFDYIRVHRYARFIQ